MLSCMTLRANIICAFGALLAAGAASSASGQIAPSADTQALQRMAATERAFAAATAEIGIRDGFIFFFAPDAIQFDAPRGGPLTLSSAQAALAARPLPRLPLAGKLMWEPFTGHISTDGTLGWLTGGFVALDEAQKAVVSQGAYFSVWKRQPDGTLRVWIDEGVGLPDVWKDAAPFRVAPEPDAGVAGTAGETVADAERSVASGGENWRARLAAGVRLHREAKMPFRRPRVGGRVGDDGVADRDVQHAPDRGRGFWRSGRGRRRVCRDDSCRTGTWFVRACMEAGRDRTMAHRLRDEQAASVIDYVEIEIDIDIDI
jgi:hypothetical protein